MAAGEKEQNKEGKGFAGLSSLVSDVDTTVLPPAKQDATSSGASSSAERPTLSQSAQPEPQPSQQQPNQAPSQPFSGSSTGKWVLGIAAVIGMFWLSAQGNKQSSSPAPAYSPSVQTTAPSYSAAPNFFDQFDDPPPAQATAPNYSATPAQPKAPSRPEETRPPVAHDLVFSITEIRYCLAEEIRLEGAKSAVNNYSAAAVDWFNAMAADYNSLCGTFRYRRGALESARRDIEPYRSQLQTEGRSRLMRGSTSGIQPNSGGTDWSQFTPVDPPAAPSRPTPDATRPSVDEFLDFAAPLAPSRPTPDATVQAIQRKLNELGYDAGEADGLMGRRTRSAILAFQRDMGLTPDGRPNGDLIAMLNSAKRSASTPPNRVQFSEQNTALSSRTAPTALPPQQVNYHEGEVMPKYRITAPDGRTFDVTAPDGATSAEVLARVQERAGEAVSNWWEKSPLAVSNWWENSPSADDFPPSYAAQPPSSASRDAKNFNLCVSGQHPSLCKNFLLTSEEAARVAEAERRAWNR